MAILFGTQSNGETLPVLVDQFGNLLAKGIDGAEGPPGPPGPPGVGELPPDPYEGAFLGWLNNGLAWIGAPPVPVPTSLFGPITAWDASGLITVAGDIPAEVKAGVNVYQCNEDESIFVVGWNNSLVWSDNSYGVYDPLNPATNAFDGSFTTWAQPNAGATVTLTFTGFSSISSLRLYGVTGTTGQTYFRLNGTDITAMVGTALGWHIIDGFSSLDTLSISSVPYVGTGQLFAVEVNGEILVDAGDYPTAPNLNLQVDSINGQNLSGVANRTNNFTIGKYLCVPEQDVARWLYDGNLNKVITSTDIDISRLTGN